MSTELGSVVRLLEAHKKRPTAPARGGSRGYDPKLPGSVYHKVINLHFLGYTADQVAQETGLSPEYVKWILKGRVAQLKLAEMQAAVDKETLDLRQKIEALVEPALEVYRQILEEPEVVGADIRLRKRTADTVLLDLAGKGAPKRMDVRQTHVKLTLDELAELKSRGIQEARKAGVLVLEEGEGVGD
ncbi:MAG: hypothetical protein KatS3mg015_2761 [Fimbriimonadales bacterium]|nr:MAG: hypothetical protein KatS3mg015_2761 [Fimbriimonadales bacterium]